MSRVHIWTVSLAALALELLVSFLVLSPERFGHLHTKVAICTLACIWILTAILAGAHTRRGNSPSMLWKFKLGVVLACWGILSGIIVLFAATLTLKWLLGLHGMIAILVLGLAAIFRGAAQHIDYVDARILDSADMHVELNQSAAAARHLLSGLSIDPAIAKRTRTAIDRATTLSRTQLNSSSSLPVVEALRLVAKAGENPESLLATVKQLEEAIAILKGC